MVISSDASLDSILVHGRIERELRQRLADGEWPVGTAFPSRRKLAKQFQVALGTIEHAIAPLLDDGTLQVVEGRGTFVARVVSPTDIERFEQPPFPVEPTAQHTRPLLIGLVQRDQPDAIVDLNRDSEWNPITIRSIERQLAATGGRTSLQTLLTSPLNGEEMRVAFTRLEEQEVDGVIVVDYTANATIMGNALTAVADSPLPVACITWDDIFSSAPHVFFDNRYMGYQAASHLIHAGYRNIAYLGPHPTAWVEERYLGVTAAVQQAAALGVELVRFPLPKPYDGMTIGEHEALTAEAYIANPTFPLHGDGDAPGTTGIIASNDGMADEFMQAARRLGAVPGHDYGLIGFDDRAFARAIGLTSMRPPLERLGEEAVHLLERQISGADVPVQVRLQAELMPRNSTLRR